MEPITTEINFTQYTAAANDYNAPDGDMAALFNLIPEDGTLKPILKPTEIFKLKNNQKAIYIHKPNNETLYIIAQTNDNHTTSFLAHNEQPFLTIASNETLTDINSLGNMLVISTKLNLHYIFRKNKQYNYLGTQLPKPELQFSLAANVVLKEDQKTLSFNKDFTTPQAMFENYLTISHAAPVAEFGKQYKSDITQFSKALNDNFEYKAVYSGTNVGALWIFAGTEYNAAGTGYELIATFSKTGKTAYFKTNKKYTHYYVVANKIFGAGTTLSVKITFYQGASANITATYVKYEKQNFDAIMASANKFVAQQATEQNKFIFPFFVRYALKLTDGSYARISEPILLVPNSGYVPFMYYDSKGIKAYAFIANLQYAVISGIDEKWNDFIESVEVFCSSPIYPYKQGAEYKDTEMLFNHLFYKPNEYDQISNTDCAYALLLPEDALGVGRDKHDLFDRANQVFGVKSMIGDNGNHSIIQVAPNDNMLEQIESINAFYRIHAFKPEELIPRTDDFNLPVFANVDIKPNTLSALLTLPKLTDNSLANTRFFDASLTTYNQRLHLYNFKMQHPVPSMLEQMNTAGVYDTNAPIIKAITVYIKTALGEKRVQITPEKLQSTTAALWFFYPHNGAYKAEIAFYHTNAPQTAYIKILNLKQHQFLNGAYWLHTPLSDHSPILAVDSQSDNYTLPSTDDISHYTNNILQSEVASPFNFPDTLLSQIPAAQIYALSSAAKALSEGQFGQFPLYAFTDEGIWAMQISDTGTYIARQPITRDVCTNRDHITQLDDAVLFVTARGLMIIQGSQTSCISEIIDSDTPFNLLSLPAFHKLHNALAHTSLTDNCLPTKPFSEFSEKARIIYDYPNQRLFFYAPGITYAYVFSLRSKMWGMCFSEFTSHLNEYPGAIATDASGAVLDLTNLKREPTACLYCTRPIKLQSPDMLKTLRTVIQRGYFAPTHINTIIYAARNFTHWHLIASSPNNQVRNIHGTPYKFFRIATLATLNPDESINGASIQFIPRQTNRLR